MTQEEENPALFHGQFVETFRKYTNIDPSTSESQPLLGQHNTLLVSPPLILNGNSKNYIWPYKHPCPNS